MVELDGDLEAELVLSRGGHLLALEHTGALKWSRPLPGGNSYSAAPSVGDIDGDGRPEILVGDRVSLTAWEADGTLRWVNATVTLGGNSVASLADLDGDGRLEVVYLEDHLFKVFRGRDGAELFSFADEQMFTIEAHTPTVADVDGDGRLDIVIGQAGAFSPFAGVRVFGNPSWAPGRSLWNQWAYRVTNVLDDQTVPAREPPSWRVHNSYRAVVPSSPALCEHLGCKEGSPDLTASFIRARRDACPTEVRYVVRVGNGGERSAPAGTTVKFELVEAGVTSLAGEATTSRAIGPGQFEDVELAAPGASGLRTVLVTVDPAQAVADGRPENNVHSFELEPCGGANRPPVFVTDPPPTAQVGADYVYAARASDPDGDDVTLTLTTAPAGMSPPSDVAPLRWRPAPDQVGAHLVTLHASDGRGGVDVQQFVVTVGPPALAPAPPVAVDAVHLSVGTDRPSYGPREEVALTSLIENLSAAGRTGRLSLEIQDAGGLAIATPLGPKTVLFVGPGTQPFGAAFDTGVLLPGAYRVVARYTEGPAESRAEAPFAVVGAAQLFADLVTDRLLYGAEEIVRVTAELRNLAPAAPLGGLAATLQVLGTAGELLEEQPFPADLGPGGVVRRELLFATGVRPPGVYRARLEVRTGAVLVAAREVSFTIASSATRGRALAGDLVVEPARVELGQPFSLLASAGNLGNVPLAALEGRLSVIDPQTLATVREQAVAFDLALGENRAFEGSFPSTGLVPAMYLARWEVVTADRTLLSVTAPVVIEAGVAPSIAVQAPACTASDVTPVVTATGTPPLSVAQSLDGQPYDGAPVSTEGAHIVEAVVTDGAGRTAAASAAFIIDRTPPVITVAGVSDGSVYPGAVIPTVAIFDANLVSSAVTLDGAPFASGTPVSARGDHLLEATAADCAGNTNVVRVAFRIDGAAGELSHELVTRGRVLLASECTDCGPGPAVLRQTLADNGIAFEEAHTRAGWLTLLRSGRFNQIVLYKPFPSENTTAFKELNEAVWLGDGLVFIDDSPDALPRLPEALGVDSNGTITHLGSVGLQAPLAPASVGASGRGVRLRLAGATAAGAAAGRTIAAINHRGLGTAVTLGWNTETSASPALYLSALVATLPPSGGPLLSGSIAHVRVTVRNTGAFDTAYEVTHVLGDGLTTSEPLLRELTVAPSATEAFVLPLRLPPQPGTFELNGTLAAGGSTLDEDTFSLTVPRGHQAISADVIAALGSLSLSGSQANRRDQAIARLIAAGQAPTPAAAIVEVLGAIDRARATTAVDVTAIRIDLARLLRAYQVGVQP